MGRSPGERNGCPLQHSGLEYCMDCIVHGVTKSWTQLSDFHFMELLGDWENKQPPLERAPGEEVISLCVCVCVCVVNKGRIPVLLREQAVESGIKIPVLLMTSCVTSSICLAALCFTFLKCKIVIHLQLRMFYIQSPFSYPLTTSL